MILLDTNVVSELLTAPKHSPVLDWYHGASCEVFGLSAVTCMEVRHGIERMPDGRRRTALESAWQTLLQDWPGPVIALSQAEATSAGLVLARRFQMGRPVGVADAQIAGTALVHDAVLATRNTKDFDDLGIHLVNPWE